MDVPLGAGVGPIDAPLPEESGETPGMALSSYDRLLVREVTSLVVAEVWHLLRLAGVVTAPPVRRAVSGGLGRSLHPSPYGRGRLAGDDALGGGVYGPSRGSVTSPVESAVDPPSEAVFDGLGERMLETDVLEENFVEESRDVLPDGYPRPDVD